MKRSSVSPEEWTRHRKIRKKIASAKWYAHKKQREIEEENTHRRRLEEERRQEEECRRGLVWPDARDRCLWTAVVAHHCEGYPVRPLHHCPLQWAAWRDEIEEDLRHLRERVDTHFPDLGIWMRETFVLKIFRQLGLRERLDRYHSTPNTLGTDVQVPWGCSHPHSLDRLWSTSPWNWIWVMTHLGNQRENFPVVWNHLHRHALQLPLPPTDASDATWSVLSSSSTLRDWLHWMSSALHHHLEPEGPPSSPALLDDATDTTTDTTTQEDPNTPDNPEWYDGYITQPDTPQWDADQWYHTDSDSESVPSSLDTYLNDQFADPLL